MPLITLGDDTKLKLKIPSKGDVDWSDDFKTQFAQKIVDHDHTGLDGKGAKLTGDSLVDGAINRASLLAVNLEDLPNVTDAPSNGHTLIYNEGQGRWNSQPPTSDIEVADTTVSIPNGGYASGIVVLTSDIDNYPNPDPNDNDYATRLANRYILNFINNGSVNITDYSGVTFIIEDTAPASKVVKFPDLLSCTIISNVDVEFHGTVENCKVLVRRPNGTAKTSLLSNGKFEGSVCDLDELVSAGHASSLTRFVQSSITADILETQMTGTDVENIEKTNLKVGNLLNNTALSTGALRLNLTDKSSLDVKSISSNMVIDGTTVNLSADSKLTTLSDIGSSNSQIVKAWDDTANRWQYLVSPSGTGKVIVSDNNEPSEVDFTLGNLTNVNLTSPANNQVLTYSGGNWIDNKKLEVNIVGNKDIDTTNASGTQILRYNGTKFTPQTLTIPPSGIRIHDAQTFVKSAYASSPITNTVNIGSNEYAVFTFACAHSTAYGAVNREIIVADSTTIVFTSSLWSSTVSVGGVVVGGNAATSSSNVGASLSVVVYENGS